MEINGNNRHPHESHPSSASNNANKDQSSETNVFVNRAKITWHEIRRQWVGDQSQKSKRMPGEPIMRCQCHTFWESFLAETIKLDHNL